MEDNLRKNEKGYYARLKSQMSDDERVGDFQRKLYQKAKQEKTFRKEKPTALQALQPGSF